MTVASVGNIIAVTAYFFLTLLSFWIAKIPKANRSTFYWGIATICTLFARLSFLALADTLPRDQIEMVYALLITTEKIFLVIGFICFFSLTLSYKKRCLIVSFFTGETILIIMTKTVMVSDTIFAIQFSLFNAVILSGLGVVIYQNRHRLSSFWMTLLAIILLVFAVHWVTYPIARTIPTWLQFGFIFGNFLNLIVYLSFAIMSLVTVQLRLIQAEQASKENAEKAIQSNKAKSEFLANMSHEIRTPMNGILGMLDSLKKTTLSESQSIKVDIALTSGKQLLSIINEILDFSKIEAGKLHIHIQDFHLKTAIVEPALFLRNLANEKGLELVIDTKGCDYTVQGDADRLRQILINLIGNAIKFTHKGRITVQANTRLLDDIVMLKCHVIDTGVGIEADKHATLFEAFNQADNSTTRQYGGTGLGLTISQSLSHLMGGDIHFTSKLGVGSEFIINLPLPLAQTQAPQAENDNANTSPPESQTLTPESSDKPSPKTHPAIHCLLVEDNDANCFVMECILEDADITFTIAKNGSEALQELNQSSTHASVILMDCQMPVMDGYECTRRIRQGKAGERYRDIPIIAMTANAMQGDKEKCLAAGMSDYITKPIDEDLVLDTIRHWHDRQHHTT